MTGNYQILAQIEVTNGAGLSFTPTAGTKQVLQRYKLLMRPGPNGFTIYAESLFARETLPEFFEFKFVSQDPNFWLYTELPTEDWYLPNDHLRLRTIQQHHQVTFKPRAMQWQYDIITIQPLDNPFIIGFNGPEPITLPNGQTALRFTSATLLPLSATSRFNLVAGKLTMPLPNPYPNQMSDEQGILCAKMYVYL